MAIPGITIWTDAYAADTGHLTTLEHGAYLLLLFAMWNAGGSLPNDERRLARYAKMTLDKWRRIAPTIMEFFTVEDDGSLTQKRLQLELKKVSCKVEKARAAGAIGGRAKSLKNKDAHVANATDPLVADGNDRSSENVATKTKTKTQIDTGLEIESLSEKKRDTAEGASASSPRRRKRPEDMTEEELDRVYFVHEGPFRITYEDADKLAAAYPNINVKGKLVSAAGWAVERWGDKWYKPLTGWLDKLDKEAKAERDRMRIEAEARAKAGQPSKRPAI